MGKPIHEGLRERLFQWITDWSDLPEGVWRRTGALNTWGTNALEGNTLTQAEVQRLLLQGESVPDRPVPDVMETIQHDRAFRNLLDRLDRPITLVTVLELHEDVFQGSVHHRPGQWRRSNVFIAGSSHRPPSWNKVVSSMSDWEKAVQDASTEDVFTQLARTHQRFEEIHPFEDGNGRIGRLLMNLSLMQRDWPPLHVTPDDRRSYLDALAAGNRGDPAPLVMFLQSAMTRSLLDLLDQLGDDKDRLHGLGELAKAAWCPHDAGYLALRCRQGALAGLHINHTGAPEAVKRHPGRPRWVTSEFALRDYLAKNRSQKP